MNTKFYAVAMGTSRHNQEGPVATTAAFDDVSVPMRDFQACRRIQPSLVWFLSIERCRSEVCTTLCREDGPSVSYEHDRRAITRLLEHLVRCGPAATSAFSEQLDLRSDNASASPYLVVEVCRYEASIGCSIVS